MSGRRSKEPVRVKWSQNSLELAFQLVGNGVPIRKAARDTGVPFSTLQERLKNKNQQPPRLGRTTVFSKQQEQEMADQIKLLAKIFYGCTSLNIRKMAYEYAEKNNISNNFNKTLGMAGRDWLKGFLKRNKLSSRKAEGTSINRATAFNKQEVTLFFELLDSLMKKYNFLPRNIFNVDETGVSSVQEPGKIIAEKGQKRVGSITSGERGKNVTAVCAMSATGVYIPPMLIFPRQRHSVTLEVDGPRGAIYKCSKNGWINEDLFVSWLVHFADYTKPSESEPILLILDNHSSHISLKAYEFCKSNNIVMLSLPPHGSHRIQPMDVSFYGPLKTAYKQECNLFMKSNLGRQIAQTNIASLFRKAYQKVATIPKAESGFAATGIYPFNPEIFTDEDFIAAEFLNITESIAVDEEMRQRDNRTPDLQTSNLTLTGPANPSPSPISTISDSLLDSYLQEIIDSETLPHPALAATDTTPVNQAANVADIHIIDYENPIPSTSKQIVTAKDLIPIPKQSTEAKKRQRSRKQHSIIITGTPLKEVLLEKENRKLAKINKNMNEIKRKKTVKQTKQTKKCVGITKTAAHKKNKKSGGKILEKGKCELKVRRVKKRVLQDSNSSNSDIDMEDLREDDDTDIDEDYQNRCLICDDYGRDKEMWYRCVLCGRWAHQECSGYDSPEDYKCDLCINNA